MNKFNEGNLQTEPAEFPADIGKQLRRAREASNLSVQSVSASLHLTPRIIIALEENNFAQFQPVFVKGYLRNYGRLLNLPVEPLIETYNQTAQADTPPLQMPKQPVKTSKSPWVFYLLLATLALSLLGWATKKFIFPIEEIPAQASLAETNPLPASPKQSATGNSAETLPDPTDNLSPTAAGNGQNSQTDDKAATAIPTDKPTPPTAALANQSMDTQNHQPGSLQVGTASSANQPALANPTTSSPANNQVPDTIAVHLSATAWVGIRDHTGRHLVYKKVPAGTELSFSGQAPFFVVLGNSNATKIEFNGKPYLAPKIKAGAVARFTIAHSN